MKPKSALRSFLALAGSTLLAISYTHAATLYWDGTTPAGAPGGGDGTWNTSTTNWDTSLTGGDVAWDNSSPYNLAVFGGTVGTVSLGTDISVGGLRFDTTGYVINTGANTLSFAATNNFIGFNRVAAATINGSVGGSGNVSIGLVNPMVGTTLTPFTLTLNGTSAGGWSGTTTIGALSTLALADSNQALLNTTGGITLNGGGITLTNIAAEASLDRVKDDAAITSNGGTITYTNDNTASTAYTETLGSTALTSGRLNLVLTNNVNATDASQTLTLSGLTHTGATNSSTVAFAANGSLNTTNNRIAIGGASDGFVGPWATVGTSATAQTDYAFITDDSGTKYVTAANITASAEDTVGVGEWVSGANVTLSGATTLTATRTVNSLRYTGGAGSLALGGSSFNLETYGILNGGSGTLTVSNAGSGALTTPTGGGFLYLTAGSSDITISSKISNNGGTVSPVINANGRTVILSGANDFTGSVILNSGTLDANTDARLGSGAAPLIVNGSATFNPGNNVTYARGLQLNNGAILTNGTSNNPTFSGNVTGTGGLHITSPFGTQITLSGTGNTFEGPLLISGSGTTGQAYRFSVASLADSATANGRILFSSSAITHGNGSVFEYTGSTALTLNNRVIEISNTGLTPTNGHQLRRNGSGALTINTALLVNAPYAQTLALVGGGTTGVNTFGGKISDNPNATVGSTRLAAGFSAGASTITLGSVQGLVPTAAISGTGIAGGTTITAINPATNQVTLSAVTTGSGSINSIITADGVTNPISLRKGDAGTWVLTGSNNYTGDTTIQAGTLQANNSSALGSSSVSVAAGAKLFVNANNVTLANNITLNGTTTNGAIYSGDLGTGNVTNLTGQITLNATSNVSNWWNARTLQLSGKITGAGGLNFDRQGSGVGGRYYITAATNDYAGATSVTGSATPQFGYTGQAMLYLGATNALPTTTALTLNYADLYLNGQSQTLPSISGSGSFSVQNGSTTAATLILGSGDTTSGFSGTIKDNGLSVTYTAGDTATTPTLTTGTVALTKIGNGTLTLSNTNTYTGATHRQRGHAHPRQRVCFGHQHRHRQRWLARPRGPDHQQHRQCRCRRVPLLAAGASERPRLTAPSLPAGPAAVSSPWHRPPWLPTSSIALQLAATGTRGVNYDALTVSGPLALDGTITVSLNGLTPAGGQSFDLIDSTGAIDVTNFNVATDLILPPWAVACPGTPRPSPAPASSASPAARPTRSGRRSPTSVLTAMATASRTGWPSCSEPPETRTSTRPVCCRSPRSKTTGIC